MNDQPETPQANPVPVAPPAPPVEPLPSVPSSWPGAFGIYKYSGAAVKINIGTLILIWVLSILLTAMLQKVAGENVGQLISFIINTVASVALTLVYIAGVRRQRLSIGNALNKSWPLVLKMIALNILVALSLALSFLLLIIPFFFVLPRLVLASYFLVDKNLGIIEAYKTSWEAGKGQGTKVWGIIGVSILMLLLMVTIIGIPFSIYLLIMYSGATAVLYEYLGKNHPAPVVAETAQPTGEIPTGDITPTPPTAPAV